MTSEEYIGLEVHQATISIAVMGSAGKLIMESMLANWPNGYGSMISSPSTTARPGSAGCVN